MSAPFDRWSARIAAAEDGPARQALLAEIAGWRTQHLLDVVAQRDAAYALARLHMLLGDRDRAVQEAHGLVSLCRTPPEARQAEVRAATQFLQTLGGSAVRAPKPRREDRGRDDRRERPKREKRERPERKARERDREPDHPPVWADPGRPVHAGHRLSLGPVHLDAAQVRPLESIAVGRSEPEALVRLPLAVNMYTGGLPDWPAAILHALTGSTRLVLLWHALLGALVLGAFFGPWGASLGQVPLAPPAVLTLPLLLVLPMAVAGGTRMFCWLELEGMVPNEAGDGALKVERQAG